MTNELMLEVTYPHRPEHVWRALTDPAALATWLMPNDFAPVVGHQFTFRAPPQPWFDGVVRCEVLSVDPPHRLVYSWQGGPMRMPTTVTWMLEPLGAGTKVRLIHAGFSGIGGRIVRLILGSGWRSLLAKSLRRAVEQSATIRYRSGAKV
jgi:uncharacterized protein YndB with AHSA1/START domain